MLALLPQRPIRENIAAPLYNRISRWGPINRGDESRRVQNAIERLSIDTRAQRQARRLSGGNQQKLTIARWLAAGFTTMLCFDPTRGIDVGTKRQIYALLRELAEAGAAILLFTSELPEIQLVCDRTIVVYRGAVTAEMPASEADEAALLKAAHGLIKRGGGGMTTVDERPPRPAASGRTGAASRSRHGWTIGVYVLLRPADHRLHLGARAGRVHVVRPQDDRASAPCRSRSRRWRSR